MKAAEEVLGSCNVIFKLCQNDVKSIGDEIPIPYIDKNTLVSLIKEIPLLFQKYPTVLDLHGDYVIVGDVHGNLHDMIRIFAHYGYPPERKYIFLGDYVDRGEYSVEVIFILFALCIKYPTHIYLLRGNHEFTRVNRRYGLYDEIKTKYNDEELFILLNEAFAYMPIAAILNNYYFLVHAGVNSVKETKIEEIKSLVRPIDDYEDSTIVNLLWSDPTDDPGLNGTPNLRGVGCYFNENTVERFLRNSGLQKLIRGHQCVFGIETVHDGLTMTIFSSSDYSEHNTGAAIEITGTKIDNSFIYSPVMHVNSRDAFYYSIKSAPRHRIKSFKNLPLPKLGKSSSAPWFIPKKHLIL